MFTETAEKSKLSHGAVCEGGVLKHALDLLDGHRIIDVLVPASFDDH